MRPTHSSPQPSRYLVMSVHSAGSALSWYKSLFMKCGVRARGCVGRKPDHAILANLLFPYKLGPGFNKSGGHRNHFGHVIFEMYEASKSRDHWAVEYMQI